jgi:hypothetical protein
MKNRDGAGRAGFLFVEKQTAEGSSHDRRMRQRVKLA